MRVSSTVRITNTLTNPHIWVIGLITAGIAVLYYASPIGLLEYSPLPRFMELFEFNYSVSGFLFLIPFLYSALVFEWKGAVLTWLFCLVIIVPRVLMFLPSSKSLLSNVLFLFVPFAIAVILRFYKVKITEKVLLNPHFWIISFMIAALTVMYYASIFPFEVILSWNWLQPIEFFEFNYNINGLLFFIPILYSAIVFRWQVTIFFWLISVLIVLPRIQYFSLGLAALATNIIFLLVPLIILIYISLERKWRDRERQASNEREIERQSFISQIFKAQENERQKIARELHDGPTQTLLVLATRANDLNSCDTRNNSSNLREQAQWIKDMALSVSEELRRLSLDLRPGMLDNLGLIPALRWLAKNLTQDGIDTSVEIKGEVVRLPSEVDINIFRIVQEALNR